MSLVVGAWRPPQPESAIAIIGMASHFGNIRDPRLRSRRDISAYGHGAAPVALAVDPQHRWFLQCCVEALSDAGRLTSVGEGHTGVYAACAPSGHLLLAVRMGQWSEELRRGADKDYLPAFVSQSLGMRGPSLAIQSACASGVATIHVACQSLIAGECDMALAGAVSIQPAEIADLNVGPKQQTADGVGAFLLKPLLTAEADGDRIHAIVLGSALAHCGSHSRPGLVDTDALTAAQRGALGAANLDAAAVGYVESHSVGLRVADEAETAALRAAYRTGSVPPEIGTCRAGTPYAGVAVGVAAVRAAIAWIKSPDSWRSDREGRPRIAAVNAIGMTGTHGHLILAQSSRAWAEAAAEPEADHAGC